jgi:hypothetical protein
VGGPLLVQITDTGETGGEPLEVVVGLRGLPRLLVLGGDGGDLPREVRRHGRTALVFAADLADDGDLVVGEGRVVEGGEPLANVVSGEQFVFGRRQRRPLPCAGGVAALGHSHLLVPP